MMVDRVMLFNNKLINKMVKFKYKTSKTCINRIHFTSRVNSQMSTHSKKQRYFKVSNTIVILLLFSSKKKLMKSLFQREEVSQNKIKSSRLKLTKKHKALKNQHILNRWKSKKCSIMPWAATTLVQCSTVQTNQFMK